MRINEKYDIKTDPCNWILREYSLDDNGKRKVNEKGDNAYRDNYFPRLEQALYMIITRTGKDADNLQMVIDKIEAVRDEIFHAVNGFNIKLNQVNQEEAVNDGAEY